MIWNQNMTNVFSYGKEHSQHKGIHKTLTQISLDFKNGSQQLTRKTHSCWKKWSTVNTDRMMKTRCSQSDEV